jgi:hypothetical protein
MTVFFEPHRRYTVEEYLALEGARGDIFQA